MAVDISTWEETMANAIPDMILDTTGLIRPMPALKTKKALDSMDTGQMLEVRLVDDMAKADILYLVERLQLQIVKVMEEDGVTIIQIRNEQVGGCDSLK